MPGLSANIHIHQAAQFWTFYGADSTCHNGSCWSLVNLAFDRNWTAQQSPLPRPPARIDPSTGKCAPSEPRAVHPGCHGVEALVAECLGTNSYTRPADQFGRDVKMVWRFDRFHFAQNQRPQCLKAGIPEKTRQMPTKSTSCSPLGVSPERLLDRHHSLKASFHRNCFHTALLTIFPPCAIFRSSPVSTRFSKSAARNLAK